MSPTEFALSLLMLMFMFGAVSCEVVRYMKGDNTSRDAIRGAHLNRAAIALFLVATLCAVLADSYGTALICFIFATSDASCTRDLRAKARRLSRIEREQRQAELESSLAETDKTLEGMGLPLTPRIPAAAPEPDCEEGCQQHHVHHATPIRDRPTAPGGES